MNQLGALNLTTPADLLAKLRHELTLVVAERGNSYALINAARDCYHLREWIWHGRLEHNTVLQIEIMGISGEESDWNKWVNQQSVRFKILRELCNGSKHFQPRVMIRETQQAGFDSEIALWDNPDSGWDDNGYYVKDADGNLLDVQKLIIQVSKFWDQMFDRHPSLS